MHVSDYAYVIKTVNNSVNSKFKDPCKSLIYRGLYFKVVVPPGIEQVKKDEDVVSDDSRPSDSGSTAEKSAQWLALWMG